VLGPHASASPLVFPLFQCHLATHRCRARAAVALPDSAWAHPPYHRADPLSFPAAGLHCVGPPLPSPSLFPLYSAEKRLCTPFFVFPSTAHHQPGQTEPPSPPRTGTAACPSCRWNPPTGVMKLEPPPQRILSLGEYHRRSSSWPISPRIISLYSSMSFRTCHRPPELCHHRQAPPLKHLPITSPSTACLGELLPLPPCLTPPRCLPRALREDLIADPSPASPWQPRHRGWPRCSDLPLGEQRHARWHGPARPNGGPLLFTPFQFPDNCNTLIFIRI
jgi:hypothetical protein